MLEAREKITNLLIFPNIVCYTHPVDSKKHVFEKHKKLQKIKKTFAYIYRCMLLCYCNRKPRNVLPVGNVLSVIQSYINFIMVAVVGYWVTDSVVPTL